MAINRPSSGAGIWCPPCQDWAFGTPLPRTGDLVPPRWFGPRILADLEIWYPDFCQLRRFGSSGLKKCLVAIRPGSFRRYQTSRFARGRLPNLSSRHKKIPNRAISPEFRLVPVPNSRSRQSRPGSRYQAPDLASPALRLVPNLRSWRNFYWAPSPKVLQSRVCRSSKPCTRKRRGCLSARAIVAAARFISSMQAKWFRVILMTR